MLQRKQDNLYDEEEKDIFLTDLFDADNDDDDDKGEAHDDEEHNEMLQDIFESQPVKKPTIMGSQLDHDPLDITTNANDLKYLLRRPREKESEPNLSQELDALDTEVQQNSRVTMSEMVNTLDQSDVSMARYVKKQIDEFDDNQEIQRLKLKAQTKVHQLNVIVKCKDDLHFMYKILNDYVIYREKKWDYKWIKQEM